MADTKISALAALGATPASGDLFVIVDVSDTSMGAGGTDKYLTSAYVALTDGNVVKFSGGGTITLAGNVTFPTTGNVVMTASGAGAQTINHTLTMNGIFCLSSGSATISGGSITVTRSIHFLYTEAGTATDDLDSIGGGVDDQILILRTQDSTKDVVVKDGTGNILCAGDFTLSNIQDRIMLHYVEATDKWYELARSDNG